jgi:hypothetical protein
LLNLSLHKRWIGENGMKQTSHVLPALALMFLLFALADGTQAQRLYDEARDKQAQEAAKLAEDVSNNSTFERQLRNLHTLSERDAEVYFRGAKRQMELEVSGFRTWGRVKSFVDRVKVILDKEDFISNQQVSDITQDLKRDCPRTTPLGIAICSAKEKLAALKQAVADSEQQGKNLEKELKARLETISDIESLVTKADIFLKSNSKNNETLKGLTEVFLNLSKSYVNYANKLAVIKNQPKDELRLILQRVAVETLQLEVDHWKTLGEIKLRRADEQEDLASLVRQFNNRLNTIAQFYGCLDAGSASLPVDQRLARLQLEKTEVTFAKTRAIATTCPVQGNQRDKEDIATYLFQTLHVAAALAARGETPMKLAELRLAQEHHRFSIRQSAVVSRGYEIAINSGTKRLARYYAGGLKPEKIAQLIHSAATVAIPAVLAGK